MAMGQEAMSQYKTVLPAEINGVLPFTREYSKDMEGGESDRNFEI